MRNSLLLHILSLIVVDSLVLLSKVQADTIFLKNGRSINGIIKNEDENSVELAVGFGTVSFQKKEIEKINFSTPEEKNILIQKWQKEKEGLKKQQNQTASKKTQQLSLGGQSEHIFVDATLNGKIPVSLLLDTGATLVVLTSQVARRLGLDLSQEKRLVDLQLADGRKVQAKFFLLESVSLQDIATEKVEAAVLPDGIEDPNLRDGILGMSFLKRFNFRVDNVNGIITLEKI